MANSVQQNGEAKKKGTLATLFEDLSIAQVIAGALAAATVFLLSSVIGVAGSLIGAAVGSVVSAVSSQVYKKMLSASADKIRDVAPGDSGAEEDPEATRLMGTVSADKTQLIDSAKVNAGATKVISASDVRYQAHVASDGGSDPALQRAHARRQRKAKVQRNVIIVSVVSALIAIAVSAVLIHVFTAGNGIGTKTEPIFTATDTAQTKQETTEASSTSKEAAKESSAANTKESSSDSSSSKGTDSSSSSDSDSSSANSGSSSSGTSSSGSSSSSGNSGSSSGSNSNGSSNTSSGSGSSSDSSSSSTTSGSGSSNSGSASTDADNS